MSGGTARQSIDGQQWNGNANVTVVAPATNAASSKTTPADNDSLPLVDSAASNVLKKLTWENLKSGIKSYYDSVTATMTNKTISAATFTNVSNVTGPNNRIRFGHANQQDSNDGVIGAGAFSLGLTIVGTQTEAATGRIVTIIGALRDGSNNPYSSKVAVPAAVGSTGSLGQWAADNDWLYICTATNTWRRVALGTW